MLPQNAARATTRTDKTTLLNTLNWAGQGQAIVVAGMFDDQPHATNAVAGDVRPVGRFPRWS